MVQEISALQALATIRHNAFGSFKGNGPEAGNMRHREGGLMKVEHRAKFTLDTAKPVFTIGSCFAREIEKVLIGAGLDVPMKDFDIPLEYVDLANNRRYQNRAYHEARGEALWTKNHILNKYSVASIVSELRRIVGQVKVSDEYFIHMGQGRVIDPNLNLCIFPDLEAALRTREEVDRVLRRFLSSGTLVVTLGMTETWMDRNTGEAISGCPNPRALKKEPGRFYFVNASFESLMDDLHAMTELARQCNEAPDDLKIIVTVSPVSLGRTFTEMDVVVANSRSKSTLRAVADALSDGANSIDYYPSYEMVTCGERSQVFEDDMLHVRPACVAEITQRFLDLYIGASGSEP